MFTSLRVFFQGGVGIWDRPRWREGNKERGMWVTESLSLSLPLLSGGFKGRWGMAGGGGGDGYGCGGIYISISAPRPGSRRMTFIG